MGIVAMHGYRRRTDITVAWPNDRMSFVDPDIGLTLVMESRIAGAADPEAEKARVLQEKTNNIPFEQ